MISPPSPVIAKVSRYPRAKPLFADPIFGTLGFWWVLTAVLPPSGPTGPAPRVPSVAALGIDGEIARCNTWPTVVQARVRPTEGGCAVVRNRGNPTILRPNYRNDIHAGYT